MELFNTVVGIITLSILIYPLIISYNDRRIHKNWKPECGDRVYIRMTNADGYIVGIDPNGYYFNPTMVVGPNQGFTGMYAKGEFKLIAKKN